MEGFDSSYSKKIGVLITNLGTPDSPDRKGLRKYLNQFLIKKLILLFFLDPIQYHRINLILFLVKFHNFSSIHKFF